MKKKEAKKTLHKVFAIKGLLSQAPPTQVLAPPPQRKVVSLLFFQQQAANTVLRMTKERAEAAKRHKSKKNEEINIQMKDPNVKFPSFVEPLKSGGV